MRLRPNQIKAAALIRKGLENGGASVSMPSGFGATVTVLSSVPEFSIAAIISKHPDLVRQNQDFISELGIRNIIAFLHHPKSPRRNLSSFDVVIATEDLAGYEIDHPKVLKMAPPRSIPTTHVYAGA